MLLNLGEPASLDITAWADHVQLIDAKYSGAWELPALGAISAPAAVLIRPDGYVAWVGDATQRGLTDALTAWSDRPRAPHGRGETSVGSPSASLHCGHGTPNPRVRESMWSCQRRPCPGDLPFIVTF